MALRKRPASTPEGGVMKKPAVAVTSTNFEGLKKAILGAKGFPEDVLGMLSDNVEDILSKCKEERHRFQQQAADMVASVLKSAEEAEEAKVAEAEAKAASLSDEKGSRDATLEAAMGTLRAKKEAARAAKEAEREAEEALKLAKQAVKDFQPQMSAAEKAVTDVKVTLHELRETAITPFTKLVEWSNVPPPEPAPAEEPAAAEELEPTDAPAAEK